jgi:integrase
LDLAQGRDPTFQRRRVIEEEEKKRRENLFSNVAEEYIKRHLSKLRSGAAAEGNIRRELITRWGKRSIGDIDKLDIIKMVEELVDRGTPTLARITFAHARSLFTWAIARSAYGLVRSPCSEVKVSHLAGPPSKRERVLTDEDIRRVWSATDDYPFGLFVRFLLLMGQRRNEVAKMRWSEISDKLWTIPAERMKGGHAHVVPLSSVAMELLESLPRFKGDYVFSTTGGARPISGFGKGKARLDKKLGGTVADWRLHDLRRTVRTRLSELRVPDRIADLTVGNGNPNRLDQYRYRSEKREALELWDECLETIVRRRPKARRTWLGGAG